MLRRWPKPRLLNVYYHLAPKNVTVAVLGLGSVGLCLGIERLVQPMDPSKQYQFSQWLLAIHRWHLCKNG